MLSGAMVPGAALNATNRPGSASTIARPLASGLPDRANGVSRAASMTTIRAFSGSALSGRM